jgi:hypothetical protein
MNDQRNDMFTTELAPARAHDALFHQPAYRNADWLETNWFSFLVPERKMRGLIYVGFRTNIGVVFSSVCIWSQECRNLADADYWDARVHLPMPPQNLDHYTLANGLTVRMDEPLQRYTIDYEGSRGTRLHLEQRGLMPTISSNATRLPKGDDFSHFHVVDPLLKSQVDHLDQTMMVEGELHLDGETIAISFPSNRDHTWAPRPEHDHGCGYFDEGHFGEELTFHVQTQNFELDHAKVTNGYILDHGEVLRLKAGEGRFEIDEWRTKRLVYDLEDERGKSYRFTGEPTGSLFLPSWPNQCNITSTVRWDYEGEVGWGDYKWHWEISQMQPLTERRSKGTTA